jgi:sensor domain CHASE-containing protein
MFGIPSIKTIAYMGLAALVAGVIGFSYGAAYERNRQAAAQAQSTQTQNRIANEASDEVRELDNDCLSRELSRGMPDGCP